MLLLFLRLKVWILSSDSVLDSRPPTLEQHPQLDLQFYYLLVAPHPSLAVLLLLSRSLVKPCYEVCDDLELPLEEHDDRGRFSDFLPPPTPLRLTE